MKVKFIGTKKLITIHMPPNAKVIQDIEDRISWKPHQEVEVRDDWAKKLCDIDPRFVCVRAKTNDGK